MTIFEFSYEIDINRLEQARAKKVLLHSDGRLFRTLSHIGEKLAKVKSHAMVGNKKINKFYIT